MHANQFVNAHFPASPEGKHVVLSLVSLLSCRMQSPLMRWNLQQRRLVLSSFMESFTFLCLYKWLLAKLFSFL